MTLKVNAQAAHRYTPRLYQGRLILLRTVEPMPSDAGEAPEVDPDPTLGWAALSSQSITVHAVPGNHDTMIDPPQVQSLAATLRRCLLEADPIPGVPPAAPPTATEAPR